MPAVAFAEVLDRAIDESERSSSSFDPPAGIFTSPLFGRARPCWRGRARYAATEPARPSRPARRLTPAQRDALAVLRRAGGASLRDDFLPVELKATFRTLARSLHPDMHREASMERQQELAAQFREVRAAYEVLRGVL